ncbi:type II toxin-antitoxin system RelE family toxin [Algoriphagus chordae]|uniref:mRNA interferase RelE/StbE n=1 Tax=Algoriphagus chordae TaxID=237019 RepID=A0A2W7RER7_9BACT|nr:type II toxin-antitoxin system RelE/ParE family toxin [Algoriphagus chordae]PZX52709.1 mRNA interferase RelE/StbE [Algoriphagus chordae]
MNNYEVFLTSKAKKQLDKLSNKIVKPILQAIVSLSDDPRPSGCKKLKGRAAYRIRIKNYRVIYEIKDKVLLVEVIAIGHRKGIYK